MAGGASTSGDDEAIVGINVTPFVDIALVLLIIFMVTAKYIVSQSIPVDLPQAASGGSTTSSTVSLSIDAGGRFFLDTAPLDETQLDSALRARHARDSEVRAVIAADRTVQHGRVVRLIDIVRSAGITKFAIQTEQPSSQ
jgi:biopolymer transport protein ExbD